MDLYAEHLTRIFQFQQFLNFCTTQQHTFFVEIYHIKCIVFFLIYQLTAIRRSLYKFFRLSVKILGHLQVQKCLNNYSQYTQKFQGSVQNAQNYHIDRNICTKNNKTRTRRSLNHELTSHSKHMVVLLYRQWQCTPYVFSSFHVHGSCDSVRFNYRSSDNYNSLYHLLQYIIIIYFQALHFKTQNCYRIKYIIIYKSSDSL